MKDNFLIFIGLILLILAFVGYLVQAWKFASYTGMITIVMGFIFLMSLLVTMIIPAPRECQLSKVKERFY